MKKFIALVPGVLALLIAAGFSVLTVSANAESQAKVDICHRTASNSNPYVLISVPADKANGHITGTNKQHNQQVTWDTTGTYDGIPHTAGSARLDYFADAGISGNCSDGQVTPPEVCPEGTDNAGEAIPEGQTAEEFCNEEEEPPVCPEGTDNAGELIPEGQTAEEFCNEEEEPATCPADSEANAGEVIPDGTTAEEFCNIDTAGEETCPTDSEINAGQEIPAGETEESYCNRDDNPPNPPTPGGKQETPAEVAGAQETAPPATAPAAVPTSVDAGL